MTFVYLATPYSKSIDGLDGAARRAAIYAGAFIQARLPVFSPIAHSHAIAVQARINPHDHAIWLPADAPFLRAASVLVVVTEAGWEKSYGISEEIKVFGLAKKPVFYWNPPEISALFKRDLERLLRIVR